MSTVTGELEQELWELFRPFYQHPTDAVREVVVLELYRRREISSGKAAELLNMERFEFIRYAARLGYPFSIWMRMNWLKKFIVLGKQCDRAI